MERGQAGENHLGEPHRHRRRGFLSGTHAGSPIGTTLPAFARWTHVLPVIQRPRRLLFFVIAGLALVVRPRHRSGLEADDIAGRWVIDYIGYTSGGAVPHYLGPEPRDTLIIFADGRWLTGRHSIRYTIRRDTLVLRADTGEAVYALRFIGPGEPRLSLSSRAVYDFNADGLPEWAVMETVFRRPRGDGKPRTP